MIYMIIDADGSETTLTEAEAQARGLSSPGMAEPSAMSCGPAQAKIVLWEMDLLDTVEAMVSAHPYKPVSIWYHAATVWDRYHPYVMALGYELDLNDEDMDNLFALAVTK